MKKKVFVQIINTKNGMCQSGMIEELIQEGFELDNALRHFGTSYGEINWIFEQNQDFGIKYGVISGTTKIVTVVTI